MKCNSLYKNAFVICMVLISSIANIQESIALSIKTANERSDKKAIEVNGTIIDSQGLPLPGVTVILKGTTTGVATDMDGQYSISVPGPESILMFTFIGFNSQEITVGNQSTINVSLTENLSDLDEVLVVGYGVQKRGTITGAVSEVKSEDLLRTPAVTTSGALVGKMQGVTARQTDARPGGNTSIQIRNMGTPLFVIDGIPSDAAQFNNLGQSDIETISVLKDAAAAIYGMRASNGVVLVTTKRGKTNQKPEISLSGYYGLQNFTRYPRPANAYQHVRANAESEVNLGGSPIISQVDLAKWQDNTEKGFQSFDYYDFIMKPNVPQTSINASASGGSSNTKYFFSLSHLGQDALIDDYLFQRTNFQSNIDMTLADGFTVGTQISGRLENREQVGVPGLDDYFNPFLTQLENSVPINQVKSIISIYFLETKCV